MTKDEIMKMAHESGLVSDYKQYNDWIDAGPSGQELIAFAKLIAEREREACAKVIENYALGYAEPTWAFKLTELIRARGQA